MATLFTPNVGAFQSAAERQTIYAASKVDLYQSSYVPDANTTLVDLVAARADFEGYVQGALAVWFPPGALTGGGAQIISPAIQFEYVDAPPHTGNTVGGAYLTDAGGLLRMIIALDPGEYKGFNANGDFWNLQFSDVFPTGI